jgi:hypothetical protein
MNAKEDLAEYGGDQAPLFCSRCGREVQHLFCMPCVLSHLDPAGLRANARGIRRLTKRPIGRLRVAADCAICTQPMATSEKAHLLPRGVVVHVRCVQYLITRLDEAVPQREPVLPGELSFEGEGLEVK